MYQDMAILWGMHFTNESYVLLNGWMDCIEMLLMIYYVMDLAYLSMKHSGL